MKTGIRIERNFWIKNMQEFPWSIVDRYVSDEPVLFGGEPTGQYWMAANILSYHTTYEDAEAALRTIERV